jgi:hypothetical protein
LPGVHFSDAGALTTVARATDADRYFSADRGNNLVSVAGSGCKRLVHDARLLRHEHG